MKNKDYILLTPEILKRCGFEELEPEVSEEYEVYCFKKGNSLKVDISSSGLISIYVDDVEVHSGTYYLHQLQHLYYDITGDYLKAQ